jgi:hypothetical protein
MTEVARGAATAATGILHILTGVRLARYTGTKAEVIAVKLKVVVHEADEGGYWAEGPSIPGCATQGETFEELLQNIYEAVEARLSVDVGPTDATGNQRVLEIAV